MNTLGNIFKVHSFGESHGQAVGCVIDACPAGLKLDLEAIQHAVDKRKTGQHDFSSQRKESDIVEIISGVFEGVTLGSPICILIKNEDAQSKDYDHLKDVFRPGHADYTNQLKYGWRDHRGGGRTSIRITAPLVAAGEIARQLLKELSMAKTLSFVSQIGTAILSIDDVLENGLTAEERNHLFNSSLHSIDARFEQDALSLIKTAQEEGDTLGGRITCLLEDVKPGVGEPIFGKFQAQMSQALFSINTVKAVEFGEGAKAASMRGSIHNDAFIKDGDRISTQGNHHGGLLGGISSGERIGFSIYFKPISSVQKKQSTVDKEGQTVAVQIAGRHDVCAVPRAVAITEAYVNIVLLDLLLQNRYASIL